MTENTTLAPPLPESMTALAKKYQRGDKLSPAEERILGIPKALSGKASAELGAKAMPVLADPQKLFNSPGHQLIASGITMCNADGSTFSSSDTVLPVADTQVSYADIVALAGDFFAGTTSATISESIALTDPADQNTLFLDKFQSLLNQSSGAPGDPTLITDLLTCFSAQTQIVQAAKAKYGSSASWIGWQEPMPETIPGYYFPNFVNAAMNLVSTLSMENYFDVLVFPLLTRTWYWTIAAYNMDHFGNYAVTAYQVGHAAACALAATAQVSADPQGQLIQAYMMNAYADHFLTDLFAPGHLRAPRYELHNVFPIAGDMLCKMMHGEDNIMGLNLTNSLGEQWVGFGDSRAFDDCNAPNIARATAAVTASIQEVYAAFVNQDTSAPANAALQQAPDPDLVMADTTNHPAMFIVDGTGQLQYRDLLEDPYFNVYSDLTSLNAAYLWATNSPNPQYELSWPGAGTPIAGSKCKDGGLALAEFNSLLYAAWVDDNQPDSSKFAMASAPDGISWTMLPPPLDNGANGATNGNPPALLQFNNLLYLAWNGLKDNGIYMSCTNDPSVPGNWGDQGAAVPGSDPTEYGAPSLTAYNNWLWVAWTQHIPSITTPDTQVLCNYMTPDGTWQDTATMLPGPGTYDNGPSICAFSDAFWLTWFGVGYKGIWLSVAENGQWPVNNSELTGTQGTTCKYGGPRLITYGGELYAFWIQDDDTPMYSRFSMPDDESPDVLDGNWIPPQQLTGMNISKLPLGVCEFGEYLAVGWVDDRSDQIMIQLATPTPWANVNV